MIPKYRAWHIKEKKMYDVLEISFDYKEIVTERSKQVGEFHNNYSEEIFFKFKDIIIMHSTGLKDKHGVEIFEGDILNYHEQIESENEIQKNIQGADTFIISDIGFVEWDEEGADFQVNLLAGDIRGFGSRGNKEYEIIGNIHENPKLLKVYLVFDMTHERGRKIYNEQP